MTKSHVLTSLSFGVHSPRRCQYRGLLADHERKRFVIIVIREEVPLVDGRFGQALQRALHRLWDRNNPFGWGDESPAHRVVALEIDWSAIVGLDYRCPLHDDGKLVLEARQIIKRCFKSVEDVRDFYSPRSASFVPGSGLRSFHSTATTPNKLSFEGWQALSQSTRSMAAGSALVSPRFARPIGRGHQQCCTGPVRPFYAAESAALAAHSGAVLNGDTTAYACASTSRQATFNTWDPSAAPNQGDIPSRSASTSRMSRAGGPACKKASGEAGMRRVVSFADGCSGFASADESTRMSRRQTASGARSAAGAAAEPGSGSGSATTRLQGQTGAAAAAGSREPLRHPSCEGSLQRRRPAGGAEVTVNRGEAAVAKVPKLAAVTPGQGLQHSEAVRRRTKSTNDLCDLADEQAQSPQPGAAAAAKAPQPGSPLQRVWHGAASGSCTGGFDGMASCSGCAASLGVWSRGGAAHGSCAGGASCGCGCCCCRCGSTLDDQRAAWAIHSGWHCSGGDADRDGSCSASIWSRSAAACVRNAGADNPASGHASCMEAMRAKPHRNAGSGRGPRRGGDSGTGGIGGSFGGLKDVGSPGAQVPRASRWTRPSATYYSSTLVLGFRDPSLPQELRRFVKSDMRLLKLYESGLPAWAIFLPCYGLPYRPWMRRALWLLFIAISIFSMGCGFYDLYKNVPFLKQVVTAVASRMYLPASELFEWLERHTQIRMSILLTYLFSKSPLLMSLMRMLRSLAALLQQLLRPVASALSAALQPLGAVLQAAAASIGGGAAAAGAALWQMVQPVVAAAAVCGREVAELGVLVLGPPARGLWALLVLVVQLVRLVAALVGMVLVGPVQLLCSVAGALSWAGAAALEQLAAAWEAVLWLGQWMVTLGRAAQRVAPAVKAGAKVAAQAAGSAASGVGAGAGGVSGGMAVWQWLGLEVVGAYNAVRMTFIQAFKSAQAVLNFLVTVANTAVQHRVSLLLQIRRFITRQKERLPPAVAASVPLPSFVSMPSFDLPTPAPHISGLLDQDPDREHELVDMDHPSRSISIHHPVFDLGMVLMDDDLQQHAAGVMAGAVNSDQEQEGQRQHQEQRNAYLATFPGEGVRVARRPGSGRSRPEPIPVPLQRGRSATAPGLRRRFVGGSAPAGGGGLGGAGGSGAGFGGPGLYSMSYSRLDAVDEEELEEFSYLHGSAGGVLGEGHPAGRSGEAGGGRARSLPGRSHAFEAASGETRAGGSLRTSSEWHRSGALAWQQGVPAGDATGPWSAAAQAPEQGVDFGRLGKKQQRRQQQQKQKQQSQRQQPEVAETHRASPESHPASSVRPVPQGSDGEIGGAGLAVGPVRRGNRPAGNGSNKSPGCTRDCDADSSARSAVGRGSMGSAGDERQPARNGLQGKEEQEQSIRAVSSAGRAGLVGSCAGAGSQGSSHSRSLADVGNTAAAASKGRAGSACGGDDGGAGGSKGGNSAATAAGWIGAATRAAGIGGGRGLVEGSGGVGGAEGSSNNACGMRSGISSSAAAAHGSRQPIIRAS